MADRPLTWRWLGPAHLDAVETLHRAVMAGLTPDVVKPETRAFLCDMLGPRGRTLGAFEDGTLAAYGVLQHAIPPDDDPRPNLAPPAARRPLRKLAGASVAPGHRGRHLQRAMIARRVEAALADGGPDTMVFATCAPLNPSSLRNLLAQHFTIRALKPCYGGYLRYVMVREEEEARALPAREHLLVEPGALARQGALLAEGWRGIGLREGTEGARLAFCRTMPHRCPA